MSMFVILGQAASAEDNSKYPEGEVHSTMVFVSSDSPKKAQQIAIAELEDGGWANFRLRKIKTIEQAFLNGKEAVIQNAYESAVTDGASIIIYQDVDDGYAI
jgi:hypothetical protein